MSYVLCHPDEFIETSIPFMVGLIQFTGGLAGESTNMFMMATRGTIDSCITFFVAFHVLNAIDNIYVESVTEFKILHECHKPLKIKRKHKEIKFNSRTPKEKFFYFILWIITFFFNVVYYYFFPFIVNFLPYIAPNNLSTKEAMDV